MSVPRPVPLLTLLALLGLAQAAPTKLLRSNGTHVLLPSGKPWRGIGVNVMDDYKCGVCWERRTSKEEVVRRISLAVDCLGVSWVRYTIIDGLACDVYDGVTWCKERPASFLESPDRLEALDAAVALAERRGFYIEIALLVSYTFTSPANADKHPPGQPSGWPTAGTARFWRVVAKRYANRPYVFFGIINEPHENYDGKWDKKYTRAAQAVVTAIRGTGAKNMVAVGASRAWARYADSFVKYPIRDANWVAAVHLYLHPEELPPIAQGYCKKHACIVEEFGPATDLGYTLAESKWQLKWLKRQRWPFAGWVWDEVCNPSMLAARDPSSDPCEDGRALRLSRWGAAMRNATGGGRRACSLLV
ncbi:hypothetical protein CHLNCDRAFT_133732 [Chlorella variabilis]|uniref:Glycoside hydrolase family 5 domain-containing protein n=1 Tax=Chlorella variabilis TaxID=554065 RepID=E1ZF50_CHLVA|nr:hypothetical protein CHLNCDRAFT_133732 [Chlorella variabilis]EFN55438.1 hypothetical protein CHLNCDRAFT_133732 [Chlorella variabilis]|eukprot:XP_005847540.1 hypothetical protein CHLNCDRAFT_133732 [Chlorella variabilis]